MKDLSHKPMLQSAPSFSVFHSEEDGFQEEPEKDEVERSVTIGEAMGSGEFSFGNKEEDEEEGMMGLIEEEDDDDADKEAAINGFQNMGIFKQEQPISSVEEHYKKMVDEHPNNPLVLTDYAHILQSKGDLLGAEEFYLRATSADPPPDSEILLQAAKLEWEQHHDQDRASSYFERATRAAPENSHVLAAYASFLWEIDEDVEEEEEEEDQSKSDQLRVQENEGPFGLQNSVVEEVKEPLSPRLHLAAGLGINYAGTNSIDYSSADAEKAGDLEEYFKTMLEENPCNPMFLKNYAQFLLQSKGDLQGAEEYYSRAILADPGDGESISKYAKLIWEQHRDQDKAARYFERSVQASPGDSHVLAAYAGFLWEAEEEDEENQPNTLQDRLLHEGALASSP